MGDMMSTIAMVVIIVLGFVMGVKLGGKARRK